MDIQTEKEFIKTELDKINEIDLVEALKNMLAFGKAKGYESKLRPMSREDFYERSRLSRKAIEENNLIGQDERKAYFDRKHAQ